MNIQIKNGKTIIHTNVSADFTKNKTGVKGLTYRKKLNCYTLAINYHGKKYHIGNYDTIELACQVRQIADQHIKDNTFLNWLEYYSLSRKERVNSKRFKKNKN